MDDGRILFPARYQFIFDDSHNGGDSETTALVDALDIYDPANGETSRVWDAMKFWDITDPAQRVERQEGVLNWIQHKLRVARARRRLHSVVAQPPPCHILILGFSDHPLAAGRTGQRFRIPRPAADRFHAQRAAARLPNGNVLAFDNRANLPDGDGCYSRALELRLDFDTMTAVKAWEFSPAPPIYALIASGAYRLDNGSTLINFGISEDPATIPIAIIEADEEGREAFRLETIDPPTAEAAHWGPLRCRAYPGPESIIGETMLRAPKPKP